jgi:hypothetical protein
MLIRNSTPREVCESTCNHTRHAATIHGLPTLTYHLSEKENNVAQQEQRLEELKQKYQSVLSVIQQLGVRLDHVHVQDNKLFIQGTAPSEDIKNKVWNQIKQVDSSYSDLTADIRVSEQAHAQSQTQTAGASVGGAGGRTYTVEAGDSLSKISKHFYGDAGQYMKIFNANRDKLSDPNDIQAGQQLTIPA